MELKKSIFFKLNNLNCEFRTLNKKDVSQDYIDGLKEQSEYIENITAEVSFLSQKKYIQEILNCLDDTICGLFVNDEFVGTAGIQLSFSEAFLKNIDTHVDELATVRIFVFKKTYRGIGLGKVLVWAATYLFHYCTKMEWFGAGMEKTNVSSYKSFLSCGYKEFLVNYGKYFKLMANIYYLKKPDIFKEVIVNE